MLRTALHRQPAAVEQQFALLGGEVGDRLVRVEEAGLSVLLPLGGADGERGEGQRALVERLRIVDESLGFHGRDPAQALAARAHTVRVVEGVGVRRSGAGLAMAREEHPENRIDLRHRADRGARVLARGPLVDDDGCRQVPQRLGLRPLQAGEPAADERGERLVELALRFHGDSVENERGLSGAGYTDEGGECLLGDGERDVLEVVRTGTDHHDAAVRMLHGSHTATTLHASQFEQLQDLPYPDNFQRAIIRLRLPCRIPNRGGRHVDL